MQRRHLREFKGGWLIGNFEPSLWKTPWVEVGYKFHSKGSHWSRHKQLIATEYNLLISGRLRIGKEVFMAGDLFVIEPGECTQPSFLSDCGVLVVKQPSLPEDKVLCE